MNTSEKLTAIKIAHTLIWVFFVSVIFYILYSGISGDIDTWTWVAIALIVGEGITLMLFKMYCPLTLMARKYSDATKDNFDIYLPEWLATYNKQIYTVLFVIFLFILNKKNFFFLYFFFFFFFLL